VAEIGVGDLLIPVFQVYCPALGNEVTRLYAEVEVEALTNDAPVDIGAHHTNVRPGELAAAFSGEGCHPAGW
jgi:hypothetical protein